MSAPTNQRAIYTIGHSTRTIEEFIEILRDGEVQCVVDVRTIPRSRTNPQYNLDALPETLSHWQIQHTIIKALGGRRSRQREVAHDVNAFWNNQSFHNYADYALSDEFRTGIEELERLAINVRCAIMCSEAVWWRCHRRIISDYLLTRGWEVFHLMGHRRVEPAKLTAAAQTQDVRITYPAE